VQEPVQVGRALGFRKGAHPQPARER
jgi:hypothetical protein